MPKLTKKQKLEKLKKAQQALQNKIKQLEALPPNDVTASGGQDENGKDIVLLTNMQLLAIYNFAQAKLQSMLKDPEGKLASDLFDRNGLRFKYSDYEPGVNISHTVVLTAQWLENLAVCILINKKKYDHDEPSIADREYFKEGLIGKGGFKTVTYMLLNSLADNSLQLVPMARGTVELGTLDKKNDELVDSIAAEQRLNDLQEEVEHSQLFAKASNYFVGSFLGPEFKHTIYRENTRNKKVDAIQRKKLDKSKFKAEKSLATYVFAPKAIGAIYEWDKYLTAAEQQQIQLALNSTPPKFPEIFLALFTDALRGLKVMHSKEMDAVHADIKPDNIFMFRQPDGSLTAKLADFGGVTPKASFKAYLNTFTTKYLDPQTLSKERAQFDAKQKIFKKQNPMMHAAAPLEGGGLAEALLAQTNQAPNTGHTLFQNDMWALGITMFNMLFTPAGSINSLMPKDDTDPLLQQAPQIIQDLLKFDGEQRPTAEAAIATLIKMRLEEYPDKDLTNLANMVSLDTPFTERYAATMDLVVQHALILLDKNLTAPEVLQNLQLHIKNATMTTDLDQFLNKANSPENPYHLLKQRLGESPEWRALEALAGKKKSQVDFFNHELKAVNQALAKGSSSPDKLLRLQAIKLLLETYQNLEVPTPFIQTKLIQILTSLCNEKVPYFKMRGIVTFKDESEFLKDIFKQVQTKLPSTNPTSSTSFDSSINLAEQSFVQHILENKALYKFDNHLTEKLQQDLQSLQRQQPMAPVLRI